MHAMLADLRSAACQLRLPPGVRGHRRCLRLLGSGTRRTSSCSPCGGICADNLSYRDVEELLVERGVDVDHVTVFRWVQRFTPLLADAARFARRSPGDRWFVDETYVKVNGVWRYVYRAIDQDGQVIDVLVSARRDADSARRFFQRALSMLKVTPSEVVTDAAAIYPAVLDELIPKAWHHVERYANNPIEADHSQLKHRLRPMRGLRTDRTAQVISRGTPSCRTALAQIP